MGTLRSNLIISILDKVSGPARGISASLRHLDNRVEQVNRANAAMMAPMRGFAGRLLAYGGAYIGVTQGMSGTVGAALKFESAMADVRKVLDVSDEQFGNITNRVRAMSRELPVSAEGIAAIYAAAGQANIPFAELDRFTEMVAKTSVAWDISQGETGQALAEIKNQLQMSVADVGLYADAINHLSNTSAARAPDLVDFSKRVAGTGEMYGFAATETLAFGSAMIAVGAQSEVASTSFRNMGRALTIGARASKQQRVAFSRLGLDAVKTSKGMQKNALKTTLDVIDKIQRLPEWERISIASALFGDEARALMPLINNSTELRRQLGLVANSADYAGSAFKEYVVRAGTVGNVLDILKNKVSDTFRNWGTDMLPSIKEAALGAGHILDTLGERASVFDDIGAGIKGFTQGLGFDGGVREAVEGLGDLLFGKADGGGAADRLGRIFEQSREWGASLRSLNEAIKDSPLAGFLSSLGGYGVSLAASAIGISLIAGAVSRLAAALYLLTGAKAAVGILKALGKGGRWAANAAGIAGGAAEIAADASGSSSGGKEGSGKGTPIGAWGRFATWLKALGVQAAFGTLVQGLADTPGDTFADQVANQKRSREALEKLLGIGGNPTHSQERERDATIPLPDRPKRGGIHDVTGANTTDEPTPSYDAGWLKRFLFGVAADPDFNSREHFRINRETPVSKGSPAPSSFAAEMRAITLQTRATGTSDVRVTNPPPRPNVTVNAPITVNGVTDLDAIGRHLRNQVNEAASGIQADMGYAAGM